VSFVKADVCDEVAFGKIIKDYEVERVVHLAAQAGVRFSLKSPHSYTSNNVDCFVSVLEQFVKAGLQDKPIVYASSSSVYGFNNNAPFTEGVSDVDHPASLYAATKRADELIAHTYNHLYNVSSVGLRFFTVYGEYGRPDMSPMIFANKIMKGGTYYCSCVEYEIL
jgi:UDP-glucuronate 4-epimerase